MEELTSVSLRSLESTHVMGRFRYHLVRPTVGSFGMALWSVYPLKDATEWYADNHPELRSWLVLPGGRQLRLDVLHTTAPYEGPGEPAIWDGEIKAIHAELSHEPRPLVAVGDLNTTWYDWHFQALLQLGLRDAAVVAGQGWRMTWPRDQEPVVPYLRIDHVLLSKGVALEAYTVGGGGGSDHHPVEVTLGIGRSAHGPAVAGSSSSRGPVGRRRAVLGLTVSPATSAGATTQAPSEIPPPRATRSLGGRPGR